MMKAFALTALAITMVLLTGCGSVAGALWMASYRAKGGYYDRDKEIKR